MRTTVCLVLLFCYGLSQTSYRHCKISRKDIKCSSDQKQVCAIKKTGLPQTYANPCDACKEPNVIAYIEQDCNKTIRSCGPRSPGWHCQIIARAMVPSCGFEEGKEPANVDNDFCCNEDTYTHVITGKCPVPPEEVQKNKVRTHKEESESSDDAQSLFVLRIPEKLWYVDPWRRPRKPHDVCLTFRNNTQVTATSGCQLARSKEVKKITKGKCQ